MAGGSGSTIIIMISVVPKPSPLKSTDHLVDIMFVYACCHFGFIICFYFFFVV